MIDRNESRSVWQQLISSSKKGSGGLYTRYVNRNAAIPMTWLLWSIGLTPNTVSIISFCVTHSAFVVLISFGATLPAAITAYALLVLGYLLDSCDGQLARVTGRTSPLGNWLDHSLDIVKLININMTIAFVMITNAIDAQQPLALIMIAAALNLLSQPAHFFVVSMKCLLFDTEPRSAVAEARRRGILSFVVMFLADYGIFIMIVLLLPWQQVFVPIYLAYGVFALLLLVAHFARTSWQIARR